MRTYIFLALSICEHALASNPPAPGRPPSRHAAHPTPPLHQRLTVMLPRRCARIVISGRDASISLIALYPGLPRIQPSPHWTCHEARQMVPQDKLGESFCLNHVCVPTRVEIPMRATQRPERAQPIPSTRPAPIDRPISFSSCRRHPVRFYLAPSTFCQPCLLHPSTSSCTSPSPRRSAGNPARRR